MEMKFSDFLAQGNVEPSGDFSISPDVQERIRVRTMEQLQSKQFKRKPCHLARVLLAAVAAAALTAGALAVGLSLRDAARADKGITGPIPEWTEYETSPTPAKENRVELVSAMCSGSQVTAYLQASPISPEVAASLAEKGGYEWNIGSVDAAGVEGLSLGISHVFYDEGTRAALVRTEFYGVDGVDSIRFKLALYNGLEPEIVYDAIDIPVTDSESLCAPVDFALPSGGYEGSMRAKEVRVYAGYVEVVFDVTPFGEVASPEVLADDQSTYLPDGRVYNTAEDALGAYLDSWYERADAGLSDAALNFKDGSTQTIPDMETLFAGAWVWDDGGGCSLEQMLDTDQAVFQHHTIQAIDLSQVESVTLGGVTYPLA